MRFHLDEHVDHVIAQGLRRLAIDVTTTTDAGLLEAEDHEHLAFARAAGRIVFTQDEDFLSLAARGVEHLGIVYCHPRARSAGEIIAFLRLLHECVEPTDMANRVEYA